MAKLFVLAIGGSGSRVLKSLVMLLASGVDINASEIVPVIMDPDHANGDMNRTVELIRNYRAIHNKLEFQKNSFFKTKITSLNDLISDGGHKLGDDFRFELDRVRGQQFKEFIGFDSMDSVNKSLTSLLFSQDNLGMDMEVGFKGNPNIGSVVLNQFKDSKLFNRLASSFHEDDRIFIISSIFGGTGAAGFPLVVKNIRNADTKLPNHAALRNAKIGAITLLPYFGVAPDEKSIIEKGAFYSKTQAALSYYDRSLSGNKTLNALYYIGDRTIRDYENNEGADLQKNDAHFVELAAAMAIVDFMQISNDDLQTISGVASTPVYKEFGIRENAEIIHFDQLSAGTRDKITKPLSKFTLFNLYLRDRLEKDSGKYSYSKNGGIKLDSAFISQPFVREYLRKFGEAYFEWLKELQRNRVSFTPFNLEVSDKNLFHLIKGRNANKGILVFGMDNYELFIDCLSKSETKVGDLPGEQKFMAVFSQATDLVLQKKYNF